MKNEIPVSARARVMRARERGQWKKGFIFSPLGQITHTLAGRQKNFYTQRIVDDTHLMFSEKNFPSSGSFYCY